MAKIYRDGAGETPRDFLKVGGGAEAKWLLSFYRDDGKFLIFSFRTPIQSTFGLSTQQETDWALDKFAELCYMLSLIPIRIMRSIKINTGVCDILSMEKDPMTYLFPAIWCLKYRLYPPLIVLLVCYGITVFVNLILFAITYAVLSRFIFLSQKQHNEIIYFISE